MVVTSGRLSERKVTLMSIKENSKGNDSKFNDKTEEHLSSAGSIVYSESIGNNSVQSSAHGEIMALDEGNIQDKGKDTDEDNEEELGVTGDNTKNDDDDIGQNNSELFDDSNNGVISTYDSIVTGSNFDIKMSSDSKRKAESGDDKTEDGKKQRSYEKVR